MNCIHLKINTLALLFVVLFPLTTLSAQVQEKTLEQKNMESKLGALAYPSGDIQKLLPSLSVDSQESIIDHLLEYAFQFKGRPYCRGSKGPLSFDCSGFTSYVFRKIALKLNASSAAQYLQGTSVDRKNIQRGDLVFFKGRNSAVSRVGHVGLVSEVLSDGKFRFIHASCTKGICEESSDALYYSKRYVGARRLIDPASESVSKE